MQVVFLHYTIDLRNAIQKKSEFYLFWRAVKIGNKYILVSPIWWKWQKVGR